MSNERNLFEDFAIWLLFVFDIGDLSNAHRFLVSKTLQAQIGNVGQRADGLFGLIAKFVEHLQRSVRRRRVGFIHASGSQSFLFLTCLVGLAQSQRTIAQCREVYEQ